MKNTRNMLIVMLIVGLPSLLYAQTENEVISIYNGSEVIFDDRIGFEEMPIVINDSTVTVMEGILRRQWCQAPEGRSPLEVIRNYESAIRERGGQILYTTRDPGAVEIDDMKLADYFKTNRQDRGLATRVFSYTHFPGEMSEFLTGKITTPESEVYLLIASGIGHWAANQENLTFFELATVAVEPMELGMVTIDALRRGIAEKGRLAIYNIYFDTGQSTVKEESSEALSTVAEFLKQFSQNKYLVVGHTDNVGSYEMNLELSTARARAVVEKLVNEYDVNAEQLKPVGVGPASPVLSNSTEEGKARNRRVEIVER